jgi:hypothetical protein
VTRAEYLKRRHTSKMNDNNNQGTPTAAPINQGQFFGSQQWYPNDPAIMQQLAAKAGPYVLYPI